MKSSVTLAAALLLSVVVNAQTSYKFDFGNGRIKKGYNPATFENFYWPLSSFIRGTKPDGS